MCLVCGWVHHASGKHQILAHLGGTRSVHLLGIVVCIAFKTNLGFTRFLG